MLKNLVAWIILFICVFPTTAKTPVQQVTEVKVEPSKDENIQFARLIARKEGISEELFIRILLDESSGSSTVIGDMNIICKKGPNKGKPVRARGLFQITECHWPKITDEQAFNPVWSTLWAAERFKEGRIDIWTTVFRK